MWGLLWTETAGVLKIHRAVYSHFVISDLPCRHSGLFDATADRRGTGIRGDSRMRDQFFETPAVSVQGKPHIGSQDLGLYLSVKTTITTCTAAEQTERGALP